MIKILPLACLFLASLQSFGQTNIQHQISLSNMSDFRPVKENWFIAGDVSVNPFTESNPVNAPIKRRKRSKSVVEASIVQRPLSFDKGEGVLVNIPSEERRENLITGWEHGDIDLELEIMLPKGSNSGIYLQGNYELQLFDSWRVRYPKYSDIGGIYRNWVTDSAGSYMGKAPLVNASRAPGLWQKIRISFLAPRFNEKGEKIANAKFVSVELNGVKIHDNVEVPFQTGGALLKNESPKGPLMIQGDHGPVAFRNIRYTLHEGLPPPLISPFASGDSVAHITVKVGNEPKLLRAFLDFNGESSKRLTHTMAVGFPEGIHYIYDLKAGNMVCVWSGDFIDATPMWFERGDGSFRPLGMVQYLFNGAPLAHLTNENSKFLLTGDSTSFRSDGFILEHNLPVFKYTYNGTEVSDKITPDAQNGIFLREVSFKNLKDSSLYLKLAEGVKISGLNDNYYVADDKKYYIHILSGQQPVIRSVSENLKELIIKTDGEPVKYSIIW